MRFEWYWSLGLVLCSTIKQRRLIYRTARFGGNYRASKRKYYNVIALLRKENRVVYRFMFPWIFGGPGCLCLGTLQKLYASMKCKTLDWNSKRSGLRFASKRFVLMASTAFSLCWMSLLLFVLRKRFIFRYIRLPVRNSIIVALSANIFRFAYGQNFRELCSKSALQIRPISLSIRLVCLSMWNKLSTCCSRCGVHVEKCK